MSKLNFVERVKARIKGGEDASLMKLQLATDKYLDKQIQLIQDRIEDNKEKVEERKGELIEFLETPDLDRIIKSEDRKDYIKDKYIPGYDSIVKDIDELEQKIENDKRLIEKRTAMKVELNREVEK